MDYRILPVLRKLPITDLLIFIIVLFVTVYADLLIAVGIGVAFAFLRYIKDLKLNYDHKVVSLLETDFITEKNNLKEVDKSAVRVLEPRGPLFFASIEHLVKVYSDFPDDYEKIAMIEASSDFAFKDMSLEITDQRKTDKALARLKEEAASLGANGLVIQSLSNKNKLHFSLRKDNQGNLNADTRNEKQKELKAIAIFVK